MHASHSKLFRATLIPMLASVLAFTAPTAQAQPKPVSYGDDYAHIVDLQGRYIFAQDFNDADGYANVFTEDGVLDWAGGEVKGREAIRKFKADGVYNLSKNAENAAWPATTRHFITNTVVTVDGDTAKAWTYWFQANNNTADRKSFYGLYGHYEDDLRRVNGQWLFSRRAIYNEGVKGRAKAGTKNPVK